MHFVRRNVGGLDSSPFHNLYTFLQLVGWYRCFLYEKGVPGVLRGTCPMCCVDSMQEGLVTGPGFPAVRFWELRLADSRLFCQHPGLQCEESVLSYTHAWLLCNNTFFSPQHFFTFTIKLTCNTCVGCPCGLTRHLSLLRLGSIPCVPQPMPASFCNPQRRRDAEYRVDVAPCSATPFLGTHRHLSWW